jgi:hypothetical protein
MIKLLKIEENQLVNLYYLQIEFNYRELLLQTDTVFPNIVRDTFVKALFNTFSDINQSYDLEANLHFSRSNLKVNIVTKNKEIYDSCLKISNDLNNISLEILDKVNKIPSVSNTELENYFKKFIEQRMLTNELSSEKDNLQKKKLKI